MVFPTNGGTSNKCLGSYTRLVKERDIQEASNNPESGKTGVRIVEIHRVTGPPKVRATGYYTGGKLVQTRVWQRSCPLFQQLMSAAYDENTEAVQSLFNKHPKLAATKDHKGDTPAHRLSLMGYVKYLKMLIERSPESLLIQNDKGSTPVHMAAKRSDITCLKSMLVNSEGVKSLLIRDKNGFTPIHLATIHGSAKCLKLMLACEPAINVVRHILFPTSENINPKCIDLIEQARKEDPLPFQPIPFNYEAAQVEKNNPLKRNQEARVCELLTLNHTVKENVSPVGNLVDAMDLFFGIEENSKKMQRRARGALKGLESVEVYMTAKCYSEEMTGKIMTLGDENASWQLVEELIALNAENICVRLTPPDASTQNERKAFTAEQKQKYEQQEKVVLLKLASLIRGFDVARGIPQELCISGCQVRIVDCDDSTPEASLTLSFHNGNYKYQQCSRLGRNFMILRPYRYFSKDQMLLTDVQEAEVNRVPLNLPTHSLLPDRALRTFDPDNALIEKKWIEQAVIPNFNEGGLILAECIHEICTLCRRGKMHSGIVYGLQRRTIPDKVREHILDKWIGILKKRAENSPDNKPVLMSIFLSTLNPDLLQSVTQKHGIDIVDPLQAKAKKQLDKLVKNGGVALCLMPALAKPIFLHMITSSDLPTLTEGANTTSFLLQVGHPYLSVLPDGDTPIPNDIGNPLEALKAKAFSFKLRINEDEFNVLQKLKHSIESGRYREAHNYVESLESHLQTAGQNKNLSFLWQTLADEQKVPQLRSISVKSLLKTSMGRELGTIGKKALLSAIDPSDQAFEEYINHCLDSQSFTVNHFAQLKMHVGQSSNNTVISAMNRIADIKALKI